MRSQAHDKAIAAVMKWTQRDEWRERFKKLLSARVGPVCKRYGITQDDLEEKLTDGEHIQLMAVVFEELLTREYKPGGNNVIDDYLKRRGWREPAPGRQYLQALRNSVLCLYEVVDSVPGSHFMARDLIRGGDPVEVTDKLGSRSVVRWDRLAARLLPLGGKTLMSGGVLHLPFEDANDVLARIAKVKNLAVRRLGLSETPSTTSSVTSEQLQLGKLVLSEGSGLFVAAWLMSLLDGESDTSRPKLVNFDGDELLFHTVQFPFANALCSGEIEKRLDELSELERDDASEPAWTWLSIASPAKTKSPKEGDALVLNSYNQDGRTVLGTIQLGSGRVAFEANSASRARRGHAMLAEALSSLVKPPLTTIQTLEQAQLEHARNAAPASEPEPSLSPSEAQAATQEVLDRHYRSILSQSIQMLGGKTPRQAIRSKSGKKKVVEWLKYLENASARRPEEAGVPAYDFTWMWEELKVAEFRN